MKFQILILLFGFFAKDSLAQGILGFFQTPQPIRQQFPILPTAPPVRQVVQLVQPVPVAPIQPQPQPQPQIPILQPTALPVGQVPQSAPIAPPIPTQPQLQGQPNEQQEELPPLTEMQKQMQPAVSQQQNITQETGPIQPFVPGTISKNCKMYTIKQGDTYNQIGQANNVTLQSLLRANPYVNPVNLKVGMPICIPS